MKIRIYTTVVNSVGNVIPNYSEIVEAERLDEHETYYSIQIHSNRELRCTKKYWKAEVIE